MDAGGDEASGADTCASAEATGRAGQGAPSAIHALEVLAAARVSDAVPPRFAATLETMLERLGSAQLADAALDAVNEALRGGAEYPSAMGVGEPRVEQVATVEVECNYSAAPNENECCKAQHQRVTVKEDLGWGARHRSACDRQAAHGRA